MLSWLRWKSSAMWSQWKTTAAPGGHRFIDGRCYQCQRRTTDDPERCKPTIAPPLTYDFDCIPEPQPQPKPETENTHDATMEQ